MQRRKFLYALAGLSALAAIKNKQPFKYPQDLGYPHAWIKDAQIHDARIGEIAITGCKFAPLDRDTRHFEMRVG